MEHSKVVNNPLPFKLDNTSIRATDVALISNEQKYFRWLVGGLSYFQICLRPDIS